MNAEKPFVNLTSLSARTGLPAWWLKSEADAGRIPFLRVGKRMVFSVQAVQTAIAEQMSSQPSHEVSYAT